MSKLSLPLKVGLLGAASLTAYSALVLALQPRMLYMARSYMDFGAGDYYAEIKRRVQGRLVDIRYDGGKGEQHIARYLKPVDETDVHLWVCFGGNAMLSLDFVDLCNAFHIEDRFRHTAFLLVDYPGYGENGGKPSPEAIVQSSTNAFRAVSEKYDIAKVSALGVSLGCAVALEFCNAIGQPSHEPETLPLPLHSLVLCCPFSSILQIAQHHRVVPKFVPNCFARSLVRSECNWDNIKAQRKLLQQTYVDKPLCISYIHGAEDEICPVGMSEALYVDGSVIKGEEHHMEFRTIPRCDHNSIVEKGFIDIQNAMLRSRI